MMHSNADTGVVGVPFPTVLPGLFVGRGQRDLIDHLKTNGLRCVQLSAAASAQEQWEPQVGSFVCV
jgi:hypothetical protein